MESTKWDAYVLEGGISQTQLDGLKNILSNFDLGKKSDELVRLFSALEALGVKLSKLTDELLDRIEQQSDAQAEPKRRV